MQRLPLGMLKRRQNLHRSDYEICMQDPLIAYEDPPVPLDQVIEDDINFNQEWHQELGRRHELTFAFCQHLLALYLMICLNETEKDLHRALF